MDGRGSRLGERLRSARIAAGLSTRALADRLEGRVKLSHATLANYERGDTQPGIDVVSAIASELNRPLQWFLQSGLALRNVRYRHRKSLVTQTACVQFEFAAQTWLDAYLFVEQRLGDRRRSRSAKPSPSLRTPPTAAPFLRACSPTAGRSTPSCPLRRWEIGLQVCRVNSRRGTCTTPFPPGEHIS